MELAPVLFIVLPVVFVICVGLVGSTRRLGFWATILLSIVLTPVGGFVAALASGPKRLKLAAPAARHKRVRR